MSVQRVVDTYFAAIRARDADGIRRVFGADAELVSAAGVARGRDAIVAFYEEAAFGFDDLMPQPGPLLVDGDRVAVEITLRMGGRTTAVADVFEITGGEISRLAIYLGAVIDAGDA